MGTGTLIAMLAAGGGALYLLTRKKEAEVGVGQAKQVVGKSNTRWTTVVAKIEGDQVFVNVYSDAGQFGRTDAFPVLQYRQTGTDKASRVLTVAFDTTTPGALDFAKGDFGISA